ncbi:RDD family protein [Burkholderiaceae bacterium]|nr:RDD family protein [Burkholderiaceae bacterium]
MAYKDPNVPSPPLNGLSQEPKSSIDQSKSFLGGQHHPWRRLFARTVDTLTAGLLLFLLLFIPLTFGVMLAMPERGAGFADAIFQPFIGSILLSLVWAPAESVLLSLYGTTPGKWLFGMRVVHPNGGMLSYPDALKRSFLVFLQGLGLGIPVVVWFTQLFAYRRLTKTGTTLWDRSTNAVVLHKKWGILRALVCTVAVLGLLILIPALNTVRN